jgi:hypothetical protein
MIRTLLLALLLTASAWAETFEEMEKQTDMTNAEAVYALGKWCTDNRMQSKAMQLYARVVKLDPNHVPARQARGEVLVGNRWVNKTFVSKPQAAAGAVEADAAATGGKRSAGGGGPLTKEVAWDLTLPKDPNPLPNEFIDGLIERMRTAVNDSDAMARAVATLVREDNWPTAFPRLCAALVKPGYGDVYGPSDIMLELAKGKRTREMRKLYPFIVKASEGVTNPEDLINFAMMSLQLRERKVVPRLTELLSHPDLGVQDQARDTLAAIIRLPAKAITAEKAKTWWNTNWSTSEDLIMLAQLRGADQGAAVEAAAGLAEMRNPDIFPILFKLLRSDDPAVLRRSIEVLVRATTLDWGITVALPPDQRAKRIELAEKWWSEEKSRFRWPGIPEVEEGTVAAAAASNPDRETVGQLASTNGSEGQEAEARLRSRGREAVPALIEGLANPNPLLRRRSHDILRETTKKDFAFDPRADDAKRGEAVAAWRAWAVNEKLIIEEPEDDTPAKP